MLTSWITDWSLILILIVRDFPGIYSKKQCIKILVLWASKNIGSQMTSFMLYLHIENLKN